MDLAPIELHLYNEQDEIVDTLSRTRIPSYLLDMAITLQEQMSSEEGAKQADALFDFIVEFYGHKITREELKKQTDLIECMTVMRSIITRASALTLEFAQANPPGPSRRKK
jgi:hypothetical protein